MAISDIKNNVKKLVVRKLDDKESNSPEQIKALIDEAEIVSFDIFDTVLKRDVAVPTDVFYIVGKMAAARHLASEETLHHFHDKRIQAEVEARKVKTECNLAEIYQSYPGLDSSQQMALCSLEREVEINLAEVNVDLLPIYQYAVAHHPVILTSDMYLDNSTVEKMLEKCGIEGYDKLFISNELQKNKASGSLYQYITTIYPDKTILHVGNSYRSDYQNAIASGWKAVKVRTNTTDLSRDYSTKTVEHTDLKRAACLDAFISNHSAVDKDYYSHFGYERFGPLLYGFVKWCFHEMKKNGVQQALFVARDGYILKQAYDTLGYNKIIPSLYFEASRRSLRVPNYEKSMSLADIVELSPLMSVSTIEQVFDSFGLEAEKYEGVITSYGYTLSSKINKHTMADDEQFKGLFDVIKDDVFSNAEEESKTLQQYLNSYNWNQSTALVDIGWGGSMQRDLTGLLKKYGIDSTLTGYYIGLTDQAKDFLGKNGLKASGYLFDCLNRDDTDIELPFRPLLETFFLEQDGSVKKYEKDGKAVRYSYEYRRGKNLSIEAQFVKKIQVAALQFCKDFKASDVRLLVGNHPSVMFRYIYETGADPDREDAEAFGNFDFYNNGLCIKLAKPREAGFYASHPKKLPTDFRDSQWRAGFLKRLLGTSADYQNIHLAYWKHKVKSRKG